MSHWTLRQSRLSGSLTSLVSKWWIKLPIFILPLIVDQVLKFLAVKCDLFPVYRNEGIVFGLSVGGNVYSILFYLIIIVALGVIYRRPLLKALQKVGLIVVLSGAVCNLLDRIVYGATLDYLKLLTLPYFNLADVIIISGILLFVASFYFDA